jgi:His/Glu/Gln/Arg/opine family amino acid ABC transporter permease subunit
MDASLPLSYAVLLLRAAGITVGISWLALLCGAVIGCLLGLLTQSRSRALRWAATTYTEVFRSIPILLLMFFSYYGLPLITGHDLSAFGAATVALTLEASSLMAEVARASLESVGKGQREAAASLGLRPWPTLRLVVAPQAARVALPPSVGVYIATLKDSSVASVIGYLELTKTGLLIRETSPFGMEALAGISILYFAINLAISVVGSSLERKLGSRLGPDAGRQGSRAGSGRAALATRSDEATPS